MKFDYIVSFYFGPRNSEYYNDILKQDKFFFVKKHVKYISKLKENNLRKVIFCFNITNKDNSEEIEQFIRNQFKNIDVEVVCFFRNNDGFSYGSWNDYIISDVKELEHPDYYFCIEDDYIPDHKKCIEIFMSKCDEKYSYICCKAVNPDTEEGNIYPPHPSISNGIFFAKSCKKVFETYNTVFYVSDLNNYEGSWDTQMNLYKYFTEMGYLIGDILDEYSSKFFHSHNGKIKIFGDESNPSIIAPILK